MFKIVKFEEWKLSGNNWHHVSSAYINHNIFQIITSITLQIAMSVKEDGSVTYHVSNRRPANIRGLRVNTFFNFVPYQTIYRPSFHPLSHTPSNSTPFLLPREASTHTIHSSVRISCLWMAVPEAPETRKWILLTRTSSLETNPSRCTP